MPIFVMFVFGSIVLGAGAMLAPALPTDGPRIGLAAALALAIVVVGAIGYAALFGWNTLVIDYLWFALLVGIFLAGTLSAGMFRVEAQGGVKEYGGWPGPRELAFFIMVGIIFAVPAMVLPVPLDTDAQGFGYLALTLRNAGSLTTLAPFHPEISYLYSPGLPALVAYLGHQLNAGLQNIELAVGAVLSIVFVWVAYDFGNELGGPLGRTGKTRRTGIVAAVCALIGTGLLTTDLDSHYPALLGLVFALAFLTFAIRFQREGRRADFIAAAITLAGVPLAQPDMTIILILGYVPWLALLLISLWVLKPRPSLFRWLFMAAGIPLLALILIGPWLAKIAPLLASNISSPFTISPHNMLIMVAYHGGLIVVLSTIGVVLAIKRRDPVDLLMLPWLILLIDFSSIGLLRSIVPSLSRFDYPFSIAWHGPIIPYIYFGANGLLWAIDKIGRKRAEGWIKVASLPVINVVALTLVSAMIFVDPLVVASKNLPLQIFGTFSSRADVEAMQWLEQNTPLDALILNYPGEQEGHWVPVIAQRNTVYFRPQPFFIGTAHSDAIQQNLLPFWQNPADPANLALLNRYHISYVIVPQIINRPDAIKTMFRWRLPLPAALAYKRVADVPFLKLVYDVDGAQVFQVIQPVVLI